MIEGKLKSGPLAFITAPYTPDGISILERHYRRRIERENSERHQAIRLAETDSANAPPEAVAGILNHLTEGMKA